MKDGRYRHRNWPLTVLIKDNVILAMLEEPDIKKDSLWPVVRQWWAANIQDQRRITEDEEVFFILCS